MQRMTFQSALACTGLMLYPVAAVLPLWAPTWDMSKSTVAMPCNDTGLLEPVELYSKFGIVDIDWSNGKSIWVNPPMSDEELLIAQVNALKAANPDQRVFIYRNLVKALPWYTSVRNIINDPAHSGFFLSFQQNGTYHVPQCDKTWSPPRCSDLYHDQDQTPEFPHGDGSCPGPCDCGGVPCGEYLWDHRNASLRTWMLNEFVFGVNGLANSNVSGFYFDDGWTNTSATVLPWEPQPNGFCDHSPIGGATEEDYHCTEDMGLTQADTTAITDGWATTMRIIEQAVVGAGAYAWQYFSMVNTPSQSQCASVLQSLCAAGESSAWYTEAIQHEFTKNATSGKIVPLVAFMQDLATFLLLRGPYAWLGYGWVGCGVQYEYPDELTVDYGVPEGTCSQTGPATGVFTREYSKATIQMDCNTWTGSIVMK